MSEQLLLPLGAPAPRAPGAQPRARLLLQPPPRSRRRQIQSLLAELCGEPVQVILTDNRSTMLSAARRHGLLRLRLHHMFLDADATILRAAARLAVRGDRRARRVVEDYIEAHGHMVTRAPRRPRRAAPGSCHDLRAIFDELNQRYFDGKVRAEVVFGEPGRPRRRRRRSIKLGSYDDSARRITIHPALDQPAVPRVLVASVVYHEMLHQLYPPRRVGQSLRFHDGTFQRAERAFEGRAEARRWLAENLEKLLRYRAPQIKREAHDA